MECQIDPVDSYIDGIYLAAEISVSQWADENRILPEGTTSEPGEWKTSRVPYMEEIMWCLSPQSPVQEVDFLKGTQIAGSETGINALGHWIDQDPSNILFVQPDNKLLEKTSKIRLKPFFESTPCLKRKVLDKSSGDNRNTILEFDFPGGALHLATAQSGSAARSISYRYIQLDEIDQFPVDLDNQGDPVKVYGRRANIYKDSKKIYRNSSPNRKETSIIYREYKLGDQRLYYVPCMHCGHKAPITWNRIRWENNDPKSTYLLCENCNSHIHESEKNDFLQLGVWTPHNDCSPLRRSYQLPGLYSPYGWLSWEQCVDEFLDAKGDSTKIQVFTNTILAEPFEPKKKKIETKDLYNFREEYKAQVPDKVCVITGGIDVQKNRWEIEILGHCEGEETYQIDFIRLYGKPLIAEEWGKLEPYLQTEYTKANGQHFPISLTCIDSGYATDNVYKFCSRSPFKYIPIKGSSQPRDPIVNFPRKPYKGKGVYLTFIGTDTAKDVIFYRLQQTLEAGIGANIGAGMCHWPTNDSLDQEYFTQLGNEEQVIKWKKGKKVVVYEPISTSAKLEALDIRVYNLAAVRILIENFGVTLTLPPEDYEIVEDDDDSLLPPTKADGLLF